MRQDYRTTVTEGRRSGSGQLMTDNWNLLKTLWGSSPATTSISKSSSLFGLIKNEES